MELESIARRVQVHAAPAGSHRPGASLGRCARGTRRAGGPCGGRGRRPARAPGRTRVASDAGRPAGREPARPRCRAGRPGGSRPSVPPSGPRPRALRGTSAPPRACARRPDRPAAPKPAETTRAQRDNACPDERVGRSDHIPPEATAARASSPRTGGPRPAAARSGRRGIQGARSARATRPAAAWGDRCADRCNGSAPNRHNSAQCL